MAELDLTGIETADGHERYVPGSDYGPIKGLMDGGHLSFYGWVISLGVTDKRIVDLGCGSGYGVARLAEFAQQVDGIDQSPVAIEYAKKHYGRPNSIFAVADLALGFPPECPQGTYDMAVTSEVIEHVTDLFGFASQLRAAVNQTGVGVVGTPNRLWRYQYTPGRELWSPSHVMELTSATLTGLMRQFFGEVELYMHVFPAECLVLPEAETSGFTRRLIRASRRSAGLFGRELLGPEGFAKLRHYVSLPRRTTPETPSGNYRLDQFPYVRADEPGLDMTQCPGMAVVCRNPL